MEPSRDLDTFGRHLCMGDLEAVQDDFKRRVIRFTTTEVSPGEAQQKARDELYALQWGPTKVPIYQLLYLATCFNPAAREDIITTMKWLVDEAKIPVDARDLLGSTAIHLTLSTKPGFDPEIAQILYDAGADVNTRNRTGANAAHEATMIWEPQSVAKTSLAAKAIEWFLTHGGNLDIKDGDGVTARGNIQVLERKRAQFTNLRSVITVVEKDKRRRQQLGDSACRLCAKVPSGEKKLLTCSKCKKAKYCAPPRACQKLDWPKHKEVCGKTATSSSKTQNSQSGTKYLGMQVSTFILERILET